jgi:hypothetical protein
MVNKARKRPPVKVPLTKGRMALIDYEDAALIFQRKWYVMTSYDTIFYAATCENGKHLFMHRFILKPPQSQIIDHINGDGLDNRRQNMRLASHSLNAMNADYPLGASGYRGVSWNAAKKKWIAVHYGDDDRKQIGSFNTAEAGAQAYDLFVINKLGPTARTNFPISNYTKEGQ